MSLPHDYIKDAMEKSNRRNRIWYQKNLLNVLQDAKEKRVREIDASIALANQFVKILEEPLPQPKPARFYTVEQSDHLSLMKPVDPMENEIFYGSTEKGGAKRYFKQRYKKSPEDRFYARLSSNWDYGWKQKEAKQLARDVNHGRYFTMKHSCYRIQNLAPDPPHYGAPTAGQYSKCN